MKNRLILCVIFCAGFMLIFSFNSFVDFNTATLFKPEISLVLHYQYGNFSPVHNDVNPNGLDASCVGMFNIGYQKNKVMSDANSRTLFGEGYSSKDWRELLREKERATQSDEDYLPLANSLAKISTPFQGILKIANQTRLQMMGGQLPYIPCLIKDYSEYEVSECFQARAEKNKKLWIVFMGDSRSRHQFYYLTNRTQSILKWTLFKEKGKPTLFKHNVNLHEYVSWVNATSPNGDQLSYLGAIYGLRNLHPPHPIKFLRYLLQLPEKLPDVLVINYGSWEYFHLVFDIKLGLLSSHSTVISTWNKMIKFLKKLSNHMVIICASQPRPRNSTIDLHPDDPGIKKYLRSKEIVMNAASQFLDFAMGAFLNNSNVIFWDSTVPFNLASRQECGDLIHYERPLIVAELQKREDFQPFMCHDQIHKSRSTIHDETTMLINLVCNKFMPQKENKYCCS